MKKNIVVVLCSLFLLISLSACGEGGSTSSSAETKAAQTENAAKDNTVKDNPFAGTWYYVAEPSKENYLEIHEDGTFVFGYQGSTIEGTYTFRNYEIGLEVTYSNNLMLAEYLSSDAIILSDNAGGYIVGRDINDMYFLYEGSNEEFITQYINDYVKNDFSELYGGLPAENEFQIGGQGEFECLASAAVNLYTNENDIQAVCLIVSAENSSTGDIRVYACSYMAAYEDSEQINALANGLINLSGCSRTSDWSLLGVKYSRILGNSNFCQKRCHLIRRQTIFL